MIEHKFRINLSPEEYAPSSAVKKYYLLSILLIIMMTGIIFFLLPYLPLQVPLFYTQPWGEGRLATKESLFLLPALSLFFLALNLVVGKGVKEELVLSKTIGAGTLLMSILIFVSLAGIIQAVI